MADNSSSRRAQFKNNDRDFETTRRNRNDHSVELRKAKKEDQMRKRRNIDDEASEIDAALCKENVAPGALGAGVAADLTLEQIRAKLQSKSVSERLEAATAARKQLSRQRNAPIDQFYSAGLVPLLVDVLRAPEAAQGGAGGESASDLLVFEAAWAVTNVASGDSKHTAGVVATGAIPLFVALLEHPSDQVAEQSVWALSNIAGDSARHRDAVVAAGVLHALQCVMIRFWDRLTQLRNACWLVSNLARHRGTSKHPYPVATVVALLPLVKEVLSMAPCADSMCVTDLSWALAYACDGNADVIDAVISNQLLGLVVANLGMDKDAAVITPSLRAVGNIIAGTNEQADCAIQCGVIPLLGALLGHSNLRIVKESCWVISNISAGSAEQAQALVESGVVAGVLHVLKTGDFKSQKEAVWVVSNLVSLPDSNHKWYLLNNGVFGATVPLLGCDDNKVVTQLLETVRELFASADAVGQLEQCIAVFEAAGGVDLVEQLQNHASVDIYNKSYELIREFLGGDDDDDNQDGGQDQAQDQDNAGGSEHKPLYEF